MAKKIIIDQEAYDPHTNCMYASAYVESSEPRTKYLEKGETVSSTLCEMRRLQQHGFGLISLQDVPIFLDEDTTNTLIAKSRFFVREGIVYVPAGNRFDTYMVRECPLFQKDAEETNFGKLSKENLEKALAESIKLPRDQKPIPVTRFGENDIMRFAFGDRAQEFGEFLKSQGVEHCSCLFNDGKREDPNFFTERGGEFIPESRALLFYPFEAEKIDEEDNEPKSVRIDLYKRRNFRLAYLGAISETGTIRGVKTLIKNYH